MFFLLVVDRANTNTMTFTSILLFPRAPSSTQHHRCLWIKLPMLFRLPTSRLPRFFLCNNEFGVWSSAQPLTHATWGRRQWLYRRAAAGGEPRGRRVRTSSGSEGGGGGAKRGEGARAGAEQTEAQGEEQQTIALASKRSTLLFFSHIPSLSPNKCT